jgi:CheY-like chemotaxis protein
MAIAQMTDASRILIVEDEKILAADLENKLLRLGYYVDSTASSGEDAVRLAQERLPSLVLMDVRLSGTMDGVEAARQIQENTGIPIVYLTAYSDLFLRDPSSMQAPGLCVAKPFLISDLQNVIEIALRKDDGAAEQTAF